MGGTGDSLDPIRGSTCLDAGGRKGREKRRVSKWPTGFYFSPAHSGLRKGQRPENRLRAGLRPNPEALACLLWLGLRLGETKAVSRGQGDNSWPAEPPADRPEEDKGEWGWH